MEEKFIYLRLAEKLANQIRNGIFKKGDRLPSIRELCRTYNISMNTAKRIYLELESQSLVLAVPQSGYFVSHVHYPHFPLPKASNPTPLADMDVPKKIINKVYSHMGNEALTLFSFNSLYGEFLPAAQMKKEIIQAAKEMKYGGVDYEGVQGNINLRRMIAARSMTWGGALTEDEVVTTNGSIHAISLCLLALGKAGDTVAIESPCYPGIFQLAIDLGFKVLELPTDPVTGVKLDALERVCPMIDICLLITNYNTPLGSCMPIENKKKVVELLASHSIPLIEDDVYGDLNFSGKRPMCCKAFDTTGNVLWCSAVSKTLAPGYRVGWVSAGKYQDKVIEQKLIHSISSPAIVQEAVANFIKSGKYEKHLRKLRQSLFANYQKMLAVIVNEFPAGTKVTRPEGGLSLWIEFDEKVNTLKLYDRCLKEGISIAPGRMFTVQGQFQNCIRISIGLPWTKEIEQQLKRIGTLSLGCV
ncbi:MULTISPECIES: PLP-dependent aminotransferase family protein [unclassified Myroides]|uniref:aminotransferase-like domain-containing protein n=1 Tax=unclassified Myroides TaxID=2642485 RepID=UPI0015F9780B|nr:MULTISPECIES: PLP-dependent aminotransferase family protein [unclassified Myroides]MBB1150499.1 PLP-dependent aminotransferase family protein [Myroides sp. NP-2]MDM1407470.1 PLP-dependent aminotransferase family protein [Myroides sp. DF42-4-2]